LSIMIIDSVLSSVLLTTITPVMVGDVLIIITLLILSALFASSEVAFFSLSPAQLAELKENDHKRTNKIIINLLNYPKKLIATLQKVKTEGHQPHRSSGLYVQCQFRP
jgi:putative hemolysin